LQFPDYAFRLKETRASKTAPLNQRSAVKGQTSAKLTLSLAALSPVGFAHLCCGIAARSISPKSQMIWRNPNDRSAQITAFRDECDEVTAIFVTTLKRAKEP
jgi:hypothetical protein